VHLNPDVVNEREIGRLWRRMTARAWAQLMLRTEDTHDVRERAWRRAVADGRPGRGRHECA
jgi:hypothetical protein